MNPFSQIIVRVPQLPISSSIEESWSDLKKSIKISSPEFYEIIKDVDCQNIDTLPERQQLTILKYLNRSKYRCVPFGTFSSIGTAAIGNNGQFSLVLNDKRKVHSLTDWKATEQLEKSLNDILSKDYKLFSNSTYYTVGNQIRFVRRMGERFELAEIERDLTISNILACCQSPKRFSEVLDLVSDITTKEDLVVLLGDLIGCGLLITELEPNLIGIDYFQRVKFRPKSGSGLYVISEHTFDKGVISKKYTQHISALIELLTRILPDPEESEDMLGFMQRFSKRFDRGDIPVMVALDPELGVGYGNLHNKTNSESVLGKVMGGQSKKSDTFSFLNTLGLFPIGETIYLDKSVSDKSPSMTKRPLPNSSSLVGSVLDDHLIVERIGGHSFTQLAGRFTAASNDILKICKEITTIEENANPEVIFFDIAYNAELSVDNVNRRQRLYRQELNLLNFTELDNPLTLDDLFISISGKEIVLRSRKLNKRMVPRMSSAYNYRRSDLPVFRFLYDLSFYGIWPDLTFEPLILFPDKQYYPRFQFRNIILSLAKVKITKDVVTGGSLEDKIRSLRSLIRYFKLGNTIKVLGGQESLVMDSTRQGDMKLLLSELEKKESLYIEELPVSVNPLIIGENGKSYTNQVIIPLVHRNEVYYGSGSITSIDCSTKRAFLPGKDWISLEIYGHTSGTNSLLTGPLTAVLQQFQEQIKCWFFIRYNENGDHLRFRIQLKHKRFREEIMEVVHSYLEPLYSKGLLSDVSLRTYNREMERYDIAGIDKVELHFRLDSELVMELIRNEVPEDLRYIHCLQLFLAVKETGFIGEQRFDSWMENIRYHLGEEHHMNTEKYKILNQYYKEKEIYTLVINTPMARNAQNLVSSFTELINTCPDRRRAPFFTDLMHMHINRIFIDDQRAHEMIIYNLLITCLKQAKYRPQ